MKTHRMITIARYTLLEAARARLAVAGLVLLLLIVAASLFVQSLAVTESARLQAGFLAASLRLATVCVMALHVCATIAREWSDKGLESVLALDLDRTTYVLGKFGGFVLIGAAVAAVAGMPLAWAAGIEPAAAWTLSLVAELAIVVAGALFAIMAFGHVMPAVGFALGLYLLARTVAAMKLMTSGAVFGRSGAFDAFVDSAVELLGLLLPRLDTFTQAAWLVDGVPAWPGLPLIALQSVLYCGLLLAATLIDFHRKEF